MPIGAYRVIKSINKRHKLQFNDFIPLLFVIGLALVVVFLVGNL